jgi:hypothetical protein
MKNRDRNNENQKRQQEHFEPISETNYQLLDSEFHQLRVLISLVAFAQHSALS